MSKKTECPKCGKEMKVVRIKDKEFLKCEFCVETTEVKLAPLSILKEETVSLRLAELKIAKEETFEFPVAKLKVVSKDEEE